MSAIASETARLGFPQKRSASKGPREGEGGCGIVDMCTVRSEQKKSAEEWKGRMTRFRSSFRYCTTGEITLAVLAESSSSYHNCFK